MFAVVKIKGMQFKVQEGDTILAPLENNNKIGDKVTINEVLLVADGDKVKLGTPFVETSRVEAEILDFVKGKKIIVFKKKRRTGYHRKKGARQQYTLLKILNITT
jgi:large subunit ribosomal protein L21